MGAWLWTGNPDRWEYSGDMRSYLESGSKYVYWSTTKYRERVQIGDRAYIWRTKSKNNDRNGIVAVGTVAEEPKEYTGRNADEFDFPSQLNVRPGWNEAQAPSHWKTGIKIERLLWDHPLDNNQLKLPPVYLRETVRPVPAELQKRIEQLLEQRT